MRLIELDLISLREHVDAGLKVQFGGKLLNPYKKRCQLTARWLRCKGPSQASKANKPTYKISPHIKMIDMNTFSNQMLNKNILIASHKLFVVTCSK